MSHETLVPSNSDLKTQALVLSVWLARNVMNLDLGYWWNRVHTLHTGQRNWWLNRKCMTELTPDNSLIVSSTPDTH